MNAKIFDVVIIGGSYAGLSAAMALGRSLRNVLVIDSGKPCNQHTPHAHNFITLDGEKPASIAEKAREQVLSYPTVQLLQDKVMDVNGSDLNFTVTTKSGAVYQAKKILLAARVKDHMPAIKGFAECWGISVLHCPYCHGYEVRHSALGVLANGDMGYEMSKLISQWTTDLTLFTNGKSTLTEEQNNAIERNKIQVIEKEILELIHEQGFLKVVLFKDGSSEKLNALFAKIPFTQHFDRVAKLGCEWTEMGHIKVDAFQKTTVAGIFAAGDCTTMMRSLSMAVATGGMAGALMNKELTENYF